MQVILARAILLYPEAMLKPTTCHQGEAAQQTPAMAYLDKYDSADGFQDQHGCHGEGVDAGIVLHEGIVLHAVTHRAPVSLSHCGVLFGGKAP